MDKDPKQTHSSEYDRDGRKATLSIIEEDGTVSATYAGSATEQTDNKGGVIYYFSSDEMGMTVRPDNPGYKLTFEDSEEAEDGPANDTQADLGFAATLEERLGVLPDRTDIPSPSKMVEQNVDNMHQNLTDLKERTILLAEELKAGPQTYFRDVDLRDLKTRLQEIISSIYNINTHVASVLSDVDTMTDKSAELVAKAQELRNLNEAYTTAGGQGWLGRVLGILDQFTQDIEDGNETALEQTRSELTGLTSYYLPEIEEFLGKLR